MTATATKFQFKRGDLHIDGEPCETTYDTEIEKAIIPAIIDANGATIQEQGWYEQTRVYCTVVLPDGTSCGGSHCPIGIGETRKAAQADLIERLTVEFEECECEDCTGDEDDEASFKHTATVHIDGMRVYKSTTDSWKTNAQNAVEALYEKFPTDMLYEVGPMSNRGRSVSFELTDGRTGTLDME